MKWLVIFKLFALFVNTQTYHQTDYSVKLERMEIIKYNTVYLKDIQCQYVWYNRTQRVINGSGFVLKDLSKDVKVEIQAYKFLSNEYRFFPITLNLNACEELRKNTFGCRDTLSKYSNLLHCPFVKGYYYVKGAVRDFSTYPPFIPKGAYKLTAIVTDKHNFLLEGHFYGSVVEINTWKAH